MLTPWKLAAIITLSEELALSSNKVAPAPSEFAAQAFLVDVMVFLELKRKGGKLSEAQAR